MDLVVKRPYLSLKPHPRNVEFFGKPDANGDLLKEVVASIVRHGLQEPLVILEDGTLLSGHIRHFALGLIAKHKGQALEDLEVEVRIHPPFESADAEVSWLIEANVHRRQLTKRQLAVLYKHLGAIEERRRGGRPRLDEAGKPALPTPSGGGGANHRVSKKLGIRAERGRQLGIIYTTPGVPEEIKAKVDVGELPEAVVAKAIKETAEDNQVKDPEKLQEKLKEKLQEVPTKKAAPKPSEPPPALPEPTPPTPPELPPAPEPTKAMHERLALLGRDLEATLEGDLEDEKAVREALLSIFGRVKGFLTGLGWAEPAPTPPALATPLHVRAQALAELLDEAGEAEDPQAMRDVLLDITQKVKTGVLQLKARKDPEGPFYCAVCGEKQFISPSGPVCTNGHGGAPSLKEPPVLTPAKAPEPEPVKAEPEPPKVVPPPPEPKKLPPPKTSVDDITGSFLATLVPKSPPANSVPPMPPAQDPKVVPADATPEELDDLGSFLKDY